MKISVLELRNMIQEALVQERTPPMSPREIFAAVQYDTGTQEFTDRWGKRLPTAPDSAGARDVMAWLERNRVETIDADGKRLSPKAFVRTLGQRQTGQQQQGPAGEHEKKPRQGNVVRVVRGEPVSPPPVRKTGSSA